MTRKIGTNRAGHDLGSMRRSLSARVFACALLALLASWAAAAGQTATQRTFAAPEDAVKALVDAVKTGDLDALLAIFGPEGRELIASSDPATARMNRQVFTVAAREQWHLEDATAGRKTLVVGNEDWPFPVPLVKGADGWRFDTAAGKEEVLARRIGRNELEVIASCRAYVTAQQRYAQQGHDGKPAACTRRSSRAIPARRTACTGRPRAARSGVRWATWWHRQRRKDVRSARIARSRRLFMATTSRS